MVDKYSVIFTVELSDGRFQQVENEAKDLVKVSRMITSFIPKKGGEVVLISVEKINTLF